MTRFDEVIPDFVPLSISSIERIKDCISWLSPDGNLLYANPQGRKALGYTEEEIRRLTIFDIDPRYTPELWAQHFARLRETGSCTFETWHRRKDGSMMPVEINSNYIDHDGKEYSCAIVRDITERKKAEVFDQVRADVLERVAKNQSLSRALDRLTKGAEEYEPGVLGALLLQSRDRVQVYQSGALPQDLAEKVHRILTQAYDRVCGQVASEDPMILSQDMAGEVEFEELREMLHDSRLGPCLSLLLDVKSPEVTARFMLFRYAGEVFTAVDHQLIAHFSRLAQIAIDQHFSEEELKLSDSVYKNSSEGMLILGPNAEIISANPAFTAISGYTLPEVLGRHPFEFTSSTNPPTLKDEIDAALAEEGYWQGEIWELDKAGEEYVKLVKINTVFDEQHQPYRFIALFSDITEKKKSEERIWFEANYDALTRLPNRRLFKERLEQELLKTDRAGEKLTLFFIDLDRFKEVNDTVGHEGGDQLLIEVARRLMTVVRATDTVARLGGDEFTVILPGLGDIDVIARIADSIIESLQEPFHIKEQVHYISASIGVTLYPDDATDIDHLIRNADQAMYSAKNLGRSRFCYFTESMQLTADRRSHQMRDLRSAVKNQDFQLYYQPIVDLHNGSAYKAEALIRWHHQHHGMVSPAEFIPLAEETGLIHEIGDWTVHTAIAQAEYWRIHLMDDMKISVNLSPVQFLDPSFFDLWLARLRETGLNGEGLCIEITEGVLLESETATTELLKFRKAGIQLAIDDFGTGYSSLAYIKRLDVDYLKIDRSFIKNIKTDASDMALVEAIIVMAHKLSLRVVAEGIETEEQLTLLNDMGCDCGQGYYFSKPLPPNEFEKWVHKWQENEGRNFPLLTKYVPGTQAQMH
jgi:diguanylate cyclase (GGDEF)-like protein/PAS domain S-box-containing protein